MYGTIPLLSFCFVYLIYADLSSPYLDKPRSLNSPVIFLLGSVINCPGLLGRISHSWFHKSDFNAFIMSPVDFLASVVPDSNLQFEFTLFKSWNLFGARWLLCWDQTICLVATVLLSEAVYSQSCNSFIPSEYRSLIPSIPCFCHSMLFFFL